MDVVFLKLGGSLITHKSRRASVRRGELQRLAAELAQGAARCRARVVVGHGSGSFGHQAAQRHALQNYRNPRPQAPPTAAVQRAAHDLHRQVVAALEEAGATPFSVLPSSNCSGRTGKVTRMDVTPFLNAMAAGLTPVTGGDVVLDSTGLATICSTESVFIKLARRLVARGHRVRRALWLGNTDGVYDEEGRTMPSISSASRRGSVGGSEDTDVTGGMSLRVNTALSLARVGVESWLLDGRVPGALLRALAGERIGGTRVARTRAR